MLSRQILRRLATFLAGWSLAAMGLMASAQPASAAVGYCNTAYAVLYDGETRSTANRMFCYGLTDSNIEGEPGNVMGPLGDGNPVVYKDDFDALEMSSGVNSVYVYNGGGGQRTLCLYTGKAYGGTLTYIVMNVSVGLYFTDIGPSEDTLGSLKFVTGDETACP